MALGVSLLRNAVRSGVLDAVAQRRNFVLWPFVMIAGLIAYRILPFEPDPLILWATLCTALAVAALKRGDALGREMALGIAIFMAGTVLLPLHGALFGTPMLDRPYYGTYSGRVDAIIYDDGVEQRWIISDLSSLDDWTVPDVRSARITVTSTSDVRPGDRFEARIRFYPVPAPAVPGGYDSQFISYFDGIGAYGNGFGDIVVHRGTEGGFASLVKSIRAGITGRLVEQLGERIGGIAAALITGDQSRITEADRDVMAEAGIAHVISISGLHLTLVAGTMFACVRLMLALNYRLSQHLAVKKVAAVFAIVTAFTYMVLSGMVIPAVRSTIMLALVFAAVLAGRQALTMRNVAIAALIIIVWEPSSVFRASFQLSFAAVVALIGAYELARRGRENRERPRRAKVLSIGLDIAMTSVIAGLATVVFTAFHFQQTAPFGILGNLMVMPIVSTVMMPAALLGTMLIPLGLDSYPYAALGWSIEAMLWCAAFVRNLSGGFDPSPILAPSALIIAMAALGWLAYFRDRIWLVGPLLAVPLIGVFGLETAPDIFIADQSRAVAVRSGSKVALIAGRNGTFATNVWSERYITEIADKHDETLCDSVGCIFETEEGYVIALVTEQSAFDEDCRLADVVITRLYAPRPCSDAAALVVDARDLRRHGTHMIDWNGPDRDPTLRVAIDEPRRPWRPNGQ